VAIVSAAMPCKLVNGSTTNAENKLAYEPIVSVQHEQQRENVDLFQAMFGVIHIDCII